MNPAVWVSDILSITDGHGPTVRAHAQGIAAIKAGKKRRYVGASGAIVFTRCHNASGSFSAIGLHTSGQC